MTTQRKNNNLTTNNDLIKVKIFIDLGLVISAAFLFAGSFPNIIFKNGVSFLAWFAYVPVLIVIRKYNILTCIGWGAIYGILSYSLFNYWLGAFHPLAGFITYSLYAIYLAVVFALFKLAEFFFTKHAYLVQWLIWLAYEYLRVKGFLGYAYGISGYSQWQFIPLIQIAGLTGVWGVCAIVTFPSFWLAGFFQNKKDALCSSAVKYFLKNKIPAVIWLAALAATLIYGFINLNNYSAKIAAGDYVSARIALIQHNTDPWEASKAAHHWQKIEAYRKDLSILKRLSDEALAAEPKTQLVVWPETAFIPRIYWHTTYREDQESWAIVKELLDYLANNEVPFLIGNDDARMDSARNRIDYNAAMLFENGVNTATYHKIHLVPFTEHFPYRKKFPKLYKFLENADTHFWEKGGEETVFEVSNFKFSSPICFEDTFGYLSRNFTRNGAEIFINMSNDAWSQSLSAQKQHLSMAVFRTVENNRPMVRSTVSGQTCVIDLTGRVKMETPAFRENFLNAEVPLIHKERTTLYTRYGDYLGIIFLTAAGLFLIYGAVRCTIRKRKREDTA